MYAWSGMFLAAAILLLSIYVGWQRPVSRGLRVLDAALGVLVLAVLVQMLPLPVAVVRALSPAREVFAGASALTSVDVNVVPLTLSITDTAHAALTLVSIVLTFWTARSLFSRGGIRTFTLIVAWGAVVLTIVAFVQHAAGTPLVYGVWRPRDPGARPLGPFINRNHFGTWGIMALCACLGYLQWRRATRPVATSWRSRVAGWMDGRGMVLQLAVVLTAAVIAVSASRSAFVALACAAGYFAFCAAGDRTSAGRQAPLVLLGVFALAGMLAYGDSQRLLLRIDETRDQGVANRAAIWRDAVPVVRDFALTGVGAGAFGTVMRVYQTTPRTYYHNEAHNQYVQLITEGGVLLTIPALFGIVAFLMAARARLRRRDDPIYWMRIASASALVGVAVQSLWETGLTLPANGMFAAALAGLLVHETASAATTHAQGLD
ncbi:MAG: O-antigen ligase family protein [Vicinamibacterales bacterium]